MNFETGQEWVGLVKDMNIPMSHKHGLIESLQWFVQNGAIANSNHPNFNAALSLAKKVTRYGSFDDTERYMNR